MQTRAPARSSGRSPRGPVALGSIIGDLLQSPAVTTKSCEPQERDTAPHWSDHAGHYHFRIPDLNDETARAMGTAAATWTAILRALRRTERKGRTQQIRDAARVRAILADHGARGLARDAGLHPQTIRAHLAVLVEIGLIEVKRVTIGKGHGALVIAVTVADRHRRPGRKVGEKSTHYQSVFQISSAGGRLDRRRRR
ncbi:MAG: hypothetical protein EBZ59_09090 [Planctomycetia bacterium]|nr:hypothetical protein [Planctomycetia bacterium]